MSLSLTTLLDEMEDCQRAIAINGLVERLEQLDIDLEDVGPWVCFGESTYRRNLLRATPGFHALILCWRSGQRSPIHDHRGSACGVRILQGVATETIFDRNDAGFVYPVRTRTLRQGQVCGSFDADIHQMSNLQPNGQDLITLHIYTPPLLNMRMYSLTDPAVRDFADPVHDCYMGAGI